MSHRACSTDSWPKHHPDSVGVDDFDSDALGGEGGVSVANTDVGDTDAGEEGGEDAAVWLSEFSGRRPVNEIWGSCWEEDDGGGGGELAADRGLLNTIRGFDTEDGGGLVDIGVVGRNDERCSSGRRRRRC